MNGRKAGVAGTVAALSLAVLFARDAEAQLKGHYIPGFTGLQSGSQGPPSISVVLPTYFYTTDTVKDNDGDSLEAQPRINASFVGPGAVWVTNWKLLGGNVGGQVLPIAFMKSRIEGTNLRATCSCRSPGSCWACAWSRSSEPRIAPRAGPSCSPWPTRPSRR